MLIWLVVSVEQTENKLTQMDDEIKNSLMKDNLVSCRQIWRLADNFKPNHFVHNCSGIPAKKPVPSTKFGRVHLPLLVGSLLAAKRQRKLSEKVLVFFWLHFVCVGVCGHCVVWVFMCVVYGCVHVWVYASFHRTVYGRVCVCVCVCCVWVYGWVHIWVYASFYRTVAVCVLYGHCVCVTVCVQDVDKCVAVLEDLDELPVNYVMLRKNPDIMKTIKQVCTELPSSPLSNNPPPPTPTHKHHTGDGSGQPK